MKSVGIIGAGIFGCCVAIELAKKGHKVTLLDRAGNILEGASTINHLRHHYGFHYPRSKETVEEISEARNSFEEEYGLCISDFFDDYYGVSLENSKTTPENFIKFCNEMKLPYSEEWPEPKYMERNKLGVCVKTPERVYDPDILKGLILQKIRDLNINLRLNSKIIGGLIREGGQKELKILQGGNEGRDEFEIIVNATYSNFNSFNKWFGFPRKVLQYELVELLEIFIPNSKKIGLTIMDGEFSSVLPRGEKGTFTLGHVNASVLKTKISDDLDTVEMANENVESNREEILRKGIEDFPFLKDAKVIRSLFITRVVKSNVDDTDERPSEITDYGRGMFSIFGGKVITCVKIAQQLGKMIDKDLGGKSLGN